MRIPLVCANFSTPVYLDGTARNRVSVGESAEHKAKSLEFDTELGLVIIISKREKKTKTANGQESIVIGAILARPDSFDVAEKHMGLLEPKAPTPLDATIKPATTVKPGQKA